VLHRRAVDSALDDELEACVEILTAEKIRAGASPEEARRLALRETGDLHRVKASVREGRAGALTQAFLRDVRYAIRTLTRRRLFATTAVVSLAVGIGSSTAVASWGRNMFFSDPAGVADPRALIAIYVDDHDPSTDYNIVPFPHFRDVERAGASVFAGIGGAHPFWASLSGPEGARAGTVSYVTGGFFQTVRPPMVMGRGILEADDAAGAPLTAVLSYATWQRDFGGSRDVLQQTVKVNTFTLAVVGVTGPAFEGVDYGFYGAPDVWASEHAFLTITGRTQQSRAATLRVTARLRPGVTLSAAAAALAPTAAQFSYEPTDYRRYDAVRLIPLREARIPLYTRVELGQYFSILLTVSALILFAACVNIANFLLSQGVVRRGEMSLRLALGATRRQLVQQLLVECGILGVVGSAAGWALALLFARLLEQYPLITNLGTKLETPVTMDVPSALFAVSVGVLATVAFGLLPALLVSAQAPGGRFDLGVGGSTRRGFRFRQAVLILQVAVSVLLSVVAGLYARSLANIESQSYPYPEVLLAKVNPNALPAEQRQRFYLDLLKEVRERPEVMAAGYSYNPVMSIGGARVTPVLELPVVSADYTTMGQGFLGALGLTLREGRDFHDDEVEASHVTIINSTLAERFWPGESAIGRTVRFPGLAAPTQPFTIVGVVNQPRCQDQQPRPSPCVYWPPNYTRYPSLTMHIRTKAAPAELIPIVRGLVRDLNRDAFLEQALTLREQIGVIRSGPRVATTITVTMAAVAGLLSAIGCAALLLAFVREAQREIAIRLALGSTPGQLTRHVMSRALWPYAVGMTIGLVAAWYGVLSLSDRLYETSVHDSAAFVVPGLVLVVVGLVASFSPTRLATRTSPATLLRN